jgi:single-stranded-DNA-specific exonuclease
LVRRGYRTVAEARRFLDADERHDPFQFAGMREACEEIHSAVRAGRRITVHGDYDVDGVCGTAIVVSALRELGARCDWLIPDRAADGYGMTPPSVEAAASRGTELIVTVDCGIGSAAEVEVARRAGIEVVVTDHHEPPDRLPDCPILHPGVSGYPFEGLCGAGVAHKLALALRAMAGRSAGEDLDLVALATVADMVPLVGENRRLVREGLIALRKGGRPGLLALMSVSRTDPEAVGAEELAFRLAPRINAAGRLYRADAGVELLLTRDRDRAASIAAELDRANMERRLVEREVVEAAERSLDSLEDEQTSAPALVLASRDLHPGVVGIAASRLVERHWRPVILISLDGERARGSGRSIPGFDLVQALDACSEHLIRHGGHSAAAGLELTADSLDGFRRAFLAYARAELDPASLIRLERVDALVGVGTEGIGLDLAEQLERLGPFGAANPDPRLLVPSGTLRSVQPLGEDGKHSRFQLECGTGSALGVAFGVNGALSGREGDPLDLTVRLEVDRWNGAVQPRLVLRDSHPLERDPSIEIPAGPGPSGCGSGGCPARGEEWWSRLEDELRRPLDTPSQPAPMHRPPREVVDRRRGAAVAAIAELVSSGESVLALCADASRRRELGERAASPHRFGGDGPALACCRCEEESLDLALGPSSEAPGEPASGLVLSDWAALARRPLAALRFEHVVVVDPPPFEHLEALARVPRSTPGGVTPFAAGFLHLAWGARELELAERVLELEWSLRPAVGRVYRGLRDAGGAVEGEALASLLAGPGRHPATPEMAGRCVRVLDELGVCSWHRDGATPELRVLSSKETDLNRSRAYRAYVARHQEGRQYLRARAQRR